MCNDYRQTVDLRTIEGEFSHLRIPLVFPEGAPNLEPREDIRITDRAPIVRTGGAGAELVQRRWSWPGPGGKPVYNFRSDGRDLTSGRCLILADGFYEFTANADPKQKRKHKWLFTLRGQRLFGIAGLWRAVPEFGEAFTMLTTAPGPDLAPYHDRQIVVLPLADAARWLDPTAPSAELTRPLPAGSLDVEQVA
jgi:putative SOS response-associated peptidase YedK